MGSIHGCKVAHELEIPLILIPRESGTYTALGLLTSDIRHDYAKTFHLGIGDASPDQITQRYDVMIRDGRRVLLEEGATENIRNVYSMDLRYVGQFHEINVPIDEYEIVRGLPKIVERFHRRHEEVYGYSSEADLVEIVSLRLQVVSKTPLLKFRSLGFKGKDSSPALIGKRKVFSSIVHGFENVSVYDSTTLGFGNVVIGLL